MKTCFLAVLFATISYGQIADTMSTKHLITDTEILNALESALYYLEYQGDVTLVYRSPAQSLREAANRLEQREKDIFFIKYIIQELRKKIERQGYPYK